jgi:hypothetical protein
VVGVAPEVVGEGLLRLFFLRKIGRRWRYRRFNGWSRRMEVKAVMEVQVL